jgi:2-polyprenyl-6-methoxyphenol hydroxylase-like FAD-dependent oxidoreductase
MSDSSDVLIVGAGVAGLSLALRLGAKGYRVSILQGDEPPPVHRPEMIQPAGLQSMAELGLFKSLEEVEPAQVHRFHFDRMRGDPLCQVDYRVLAHATPYALITLPDRVRHLFERALDACPTVKVHRNVRITELVRQGAQVVGVKAVEGGQEREFSACVTIGADGCGSWVRGALGIRSQVKRYRNGFLGMLVQCPSKFWNLQNQVRYYLGLGRILGLFPCSADRLCLLYMVPADRIPTMGQEGLDRVKQHIARVEPRIGDALRTITSWEHVSRLVPMRVRTAKWVVDGAALIGDAAHACHPHVAQGTFQAMEDGKALAEVLDTSCFGRGDFSARALAPYEEARRPVIERIQRVADEYVWLWETGNPLVAWLRDRIFRNIGDRPHLLQRVAATEAGIDPSPLTFGERLQALGLCV